MVKDWFIEWSDKNALIRRKVRYEQMKIGDSVMIRVSPSRRLENVAYFQSAMLADGSILRDCGAGALADAVEKGADLDCRRWRDETHGIGRTDWRVRCGALLTALPVSVHAQGTRAELEGVSIVNGTRTENLKLTQEGAAARARYDHLHDDPAMRCIPATFKRVMHTPSPPIEVRLHDDYAEINYEFMDVHRRVPIKNGLAAKDAPLPCLSSRILADPPGTGKATRWSSSPPT